MNPCQAHDFNNMEVNIKDKNTTTLTGKFVFKSDFFGNLVLWVEYKNHSEPYIRWRKAKFEDLPYLNFKQ